MTTAPNLDSGPLLYWRIIRTLHAAYGFFQSRTVVELVGGVVGGMVAGVQGAAIGYVLGTCVLCPVYLRSIGKALAADHQAQGDRRLPGPGSTTSREGRMATW